MKYIVSRKEFGDQLYKSKSLLEKTNWLENKQKEWDQSFSELIMPFHDNILNLITELKDKYNDKDDPLEVFKTYNEFIEAAFEELNDKVRLATEDDNFSRLWEELKLGFSLWKESFKQMSEKMDNYNSIFKLGYEIFSVFNRYVTKKISEDYYDCLKGELDDQRENIISFFDTTYEDIKIRISELDPENIFEISNLDEKETDDINFNAGDEVRYYKNDGEENVAIISHNQEELQSEEDNIRLVSKDTGEQFEVDKSDIIEIIPKHKTINQEVGDKLKKIKNDPEQLAKLNDFLDDIKNENLFIEDDSQEVISADDYRIKKRQAQYWLSDQNFKKIHEQKIQSILRDVYKPSKNWGKHKVWGVINLPWEEDEWSILNKISSTPACIPVIINEANKYIIENGISDEVKIFNLNKHSFGTKEFYSEYERLMSFLKSYKRQFFLKSSKGGGSDMINNIIESITNSKRNRKSSDNITTEYLTRIFPDAVNIKDLTGYVRGEKTPGVDITFDLYDKTLSVHVKNCSGIFYEESQDYRITGANFTTHYNVDYLSCVTKYSVYFFEYNKDKIRLLPNGDMTVSEELLIQKFKVS